MVKRIYVTLIVLAFSLLVACQQAPPTIDNAALEEAQQRISELEGDLAAAQESEESAELVTELQNQLATAEAAAAVAEEAAAAPEEPTVEEEEEQEVQVLEVWTHEFPPLQSALTDKWIPEFEAANPGVQVNMTAIPFAGVVAYDAKLLSALSGGEGPDLWDMGDWHYRGFQEAGYLAPLDPAVFGFESAEDMIAAYAPGTMDVFVQDGQVYGLFSEYNTLAMFYNLDLFEEAGIEPLPMDEPISWDQVGEIGRQLYEEDAETGAINQMGLQFGFFANYRSPQWYAHAYYAFLRQYGQNDIYIDGEPAANTEAAVNAFQEIYDLTYEYNAYDPTFINNWFADLPQGRIGMVLAGTWFEPAAAENNPDWRFAVAPHPVVDPENPDTYKNIQWSWGWSVNANKPPEQQQLAQEFMAFILGKQGETEQAAWWFDNLGYMQPSLAFIESDTYSETLAEKPWLQVWLDAFEDYEIEYIPHMYDEQGLALMRAIDRVVYDGMTAQETADLLQAELERSQ